jgi:two-component system NtrC family sensor kinase
MGLAFGLLSFAVASLTDATVTSRRAQAARSLGRAIAIGLAHAEDEGGVSALQRGLALHATQEHVAGICAYDADGARLGCGGSSEEVATMPSTRLATAESLRTIHNSSRTELEIDSPKPRGGLVVTHLRIDAEGEYGAQLARLVALYTAFFALTLLLFAYFALTRLIVRPIEQLASAADRVAAGARTLRVPTGGARELVALGHSVQTMTNALIAEEQALQMKVTELTDTTTRLTLTQAQLIRSERMASVGRLATGIAHELGNPIAAIMGFEDLLLETELAPEAQRDFLRRMRNETQRIHTVIRDLLDFARPEAPSSDTAEPPANVCEVVHDVLALVRPQRSFRTVTLQADIPRSLHVKLSASRLTQVLLNLLLNAGAAVGSSDTPTTGRVLVRAQATDDHGRVRIEIEDDGPGVSAAVRDQLFEPFVTTKGPGDGTGLGLAVCRGLVESAGGDIGFDSTRTQGALFYVLLPAAED